MHISIMLSGVMACRLFPMHVFIMLSGMIVCRQLPMHISIMLSGMTACRQFPISFPFGRLTFRLHEYHWILSRASVWLKFSL
jgi:hypothetical protein